MKFRESKEKREELLALTSGSTGWILQVRDGLVLMCCRLEPHSGSIHAISSTVCAFLAALPCEREVDTQIGREEGKLAEAILEVHAETIKPSSYWEGVNWKYLMDRSNGVAAGGEAEWDKPELLSSANLTLYSSMLFAWPCPWAPDHLLQVCLHASTDLLLTPPVVKQIHRAWMQAVVVWSLWESEK